ncbi:hypothetical protein GCM10009846_19960 [Agrococcus versicolor]|uniref:ABC transmembrane type-1 domain-containing protein n=1 Tax=Agrococcus versicolor TaxID=501482 RepID=A0ABN3AT87_9MICO
MTRPRLASLRPLLLGLVGVLALAVLWEAYKAIGPAEGWSVGDVSVLPRTTDLAMPHVWDMLGRAFAPVRNGSDELVLQAVLAACLTSAATAIVGLLVGAIVGFGLALVMQALPIAQAAMLPWLILSQTVPLIALAPIVVSWGGRIDGWERWMSVAVIASYLAFFPVAVGALRGLQSPTAAQVDLLRSQGASWWATLRHLRLPSAVPYLLSALRLAAAAAIVGAVVAEVSTGSRGGIGRLIVEYAQAGSSDPARGWAPIFGAVLMGLAVAGLVTLAGLALSRYRRLEAA